MDAVPSYAWLICAACGALVVVELVLWYKLHASLLPLLVLRHRPVRELPRVQDVHKLHDFQGNGFTVSWRTLREQRTILFRRRMSMGRKAYVCGAVVFGRDGRPVVRWAPSPLLLYLLLPGLLLPMAFLEGGGRHDTFVFLGAILVATVLVGSINAVGAWWFLKKTGLPELQQQLEGWLE